MNIFKLSRTDMVRLLYSLKGQGEHSPLDIRPISEHVSRKSSQSSRNS